MERTAKRPVPTDVITPRQTLAFGLTLSVLSTVILALGVNLLAAAVAVGICTAAKYPGGILLPFLLYVVFCRRDTVTGRNAAGESPASEPVEFTVP